MKVTEANVEGIVASLLEGVKLPQKQESYIGVHGSDKGERFEFTVYLDPVKYEWTTKERALHSYVMQKLNPFIKQAIKNKIENDEKN